MCVEALGESDRLGEAEAEFFLREVAREHGRDWVDVVNPRDLSTVFLSCSRQEAIDKMRAERDQHAENWDKAAREALKDLGNRQIGSAFDHTCEAWKEAGRTFKADADANMVRNGGEPRWHDENGDSLPKERSGGRPERCP